MNEHIPLHLLRRYLSGSEELECRDHEQINGHIRACMFCREAMEQLQFYCENQTIPYSPRLHDFARDVLDGISTGTKAKIFHLNPVHQVAPETARVTRLAAASTSETHFVGMMTWTSDDGSLALHVSKDTRKGEYIATLISEEEHDLHGVWIRFENLSGPVLTDNDGRAVIPGQHDSFHLQHPVLVFPVFCLQLNESQLFVLHTSGSLAVTAGSWQLYFDTEPEEKRLSIYLSDGDPPLHSIAIMGKRTSIRQLSDGIVDFPLNIIQPSQTIVLYPNPDGAMEK